MKGWDSRWLFGLLALVVVGLVILSLQAGHDHLDHAAHGVPARAIVPIPHDPASGLERYAARPVPEEARCPVCGMYPARTPRWAAQLIFNDGGALFFDSPLELFRFLLRMDLYHAGHDAQDVARAYVSDAGDGRWVSIAEAYFVQGSRQLGPMRNQDLPAFAEHGDAEAFMAEQGGTLIRLEQITLDLLQSVEHAGHQALP